MLNQVILVGRLTSNPEVETLENGKKVSSIVLAVGRSFKNSEGVFETDFIRCVLWNNIAQNTTDYCRKGDVIGVKGRIQVGSYEKDAIEVIAEKITFLSSKGE